MNRKTCILWRQCHVDQRFPRDWPRSALAGHLRRSPNVDQDVFRPVPHPVTHHSAILTGDHFSRILLYNQVCRRCHSILHLTLVQNYREYLGLFPVFGSQLQSRIQRPRHLHQLVLVPLRGLVQSQ